MILASLVSFTLFASVLVIIARLGRGSGDWLANMFSAPTLPDRPRGVQEDDLPPFVFGDAQPVG